MNNRDIAEFMAERFKPAGVSMDTPYSYREAGNGFYVVEKTWGQHLIEQYMEDADAFLFLLESKRLQITEKPLV